MRHLPSLFAAVLVLAAWCVQGCAAKPKALTVFAAASLADALQEIAEDYRQSTGHRVRFNFAGSGLLARQIGEGAPADVFLSADELRIDQLLEAGRLERGSRRTFARNALAVVATPDAAESIKTLRDLLKPEIRRIAMGHPATVPAGTYAQAHLEAQELWQPLQSKIMPFENVRAVLAAVDAGHADVGLVYRTDALVARQARIALEVPEAQGPAIRYVAAVVQDTKESDLAVDFLRRLTEPAAQAIFAQHGFLAP